MALIMVAGAAVPAGAGVDRGERFSLRGHVFVTVLKGAAEVPPADPDGLGLAVVTAHKKTGRVCFLLLATGISTAVAAHIHQAPEGVSGPIVVPLTTPVNGFSVGCVTADPALVGDIVAHPEGYYVNIHSTEFPLGAIRGQLR